MQIRVKFFAILRDKARAAEATLDLPQDATIATAAEAIAAKYPTLRDHLSRIAYAVNREYAPRDTQLHDGDELALIPPVSGGAR